MATVLLATDGSDLATAAMVRGVQLLGRDHRFIVLTVVPPAFAPTAAVTPMDTHPTLVDPAVEAQHRNEDWAESNEELVELVRLLDVPAEPLVETGDPGVAICQVADEQRADVVVVGSHGHGWLQRVLVGSVSHHVVHNANCPVLVMRLQAPAAEEG